MKNSTTEPFDTANSNAMLGAVRFRSHEAQKVNNIFENHFGVKFQTFWKNHFQNIIFCFFQNSCRLQSKNH